VELRARAVGLDAGCMWGYDGIVLSAAVHELATFVVLTAAAVWLVVHLARISRPRGQVGCARCEHNVLGAGESTRPSTGVRSKQLRVLG
jgi:hypothetical protein